MSKGSDGEFRMGQASRYVNEIYQSVKDFSATSVSSRVFIKDSLFNLPADNVATPVIMVGPGTGIAPFIGFMEERQHQLKSKESTEDDGANWHLFFGCRRKNYDFIYSHYLEEFEKLGVVRKVHLALSREDPMKKHYVQDLMRIESDLLKEMLSQEKKGHLYICGSTKMGSDVQALLKELLGEEGFKALEKEKRLIKELWG